MKKICIIIPYFGKLPEYFELWLESVKANNEIDFLLITDQKLTTDLKNLKIIIKTFEQQKDEIQRYFKFKINLEKPYKLCDYKPMYGLLYKEYIQKYEWWGFCDMDLIFGDLKYFFEKINFDEYERILKRGHLSLFKNTQEINEYFMTLKYSGISYKEAFSSSKNFAFDETNGTTKMFLENGKKVYMEEIIADIKYNTKRLELTDANLIKNKKNQLFVYENQKIYMYYLENDFIKKHEFLYLHFQKRNLKKIGNIYENEAFFITSNGFIRKDKEITKKDFNKYNGRKGNLKFKINYIYKSILRKLKI